MTSEYLQIRINGEIKAKLAEIARRKGVSLSALMIYAATTMYEQELKEIK